jgi:Ni,Fe-hydrogenase I large subunit
VYVPDLLAIASYYPDWFERGEGLGNFMAYGDYPAGSLKTIESYGFKRGMILNRDLSTVHAVDPRQITENVARSWYEYDGASGVALHPSEGQTHPRYAGPVPPYEFLDVEAKYSWLKSPRYDNRPMEVGPLARMLVNYAAGQPDIKSAVDGALLAAKLQPQALYSTLGRVAARGIEAKVLAAKVPGWIDELDANMHRGELRIHNGDMWDPASWPKQAQGAGLHEAPRGSLGHWVEIENGKIKNYQVVAPTTWLAGPRDANGVRGAYEAALLNTPLVNPEQPLEILRTVHSFDPCLACAVHVVDAAEVELAHEILTCV